MNTFQRLFFLAFLALLGLYWLHAAQGSDYTWSGEGVYYLIAMVFVFVVGLFAFIADKIKKKKKNV